MRIHLSNVDVMVKAVKEEGFSGLTALEVAYDTHVDDTLPPFSEEYFSQQLRLYSEISGRVLDQESGELHPVDMEALLKAPNPIGIYDVEHIVEHVRCLSTMLSLAELRGRPEVLDMGAGHGISSEVFAFSACRVHAIDIDPVLGALSLERARVRGLAIERSVMNFDQIETLDNDRYDAAFFFQSLHHCLRPWDLIKILSEKLIDDAVIGFAGEPVQANWWAHWGLRLDAESLFVAREHGWFESGWSHDFIAKCFERNGFTLTFFTGGLGGQQIGIATRSASRLEKVRAKAALLSLTEFIPMRAPQ